MSKFLFPPFQTPGIPVKGEAALYPVNRIFCVGRNYAAHAAEMGNEVDREAPFYFTKAPAAFAPSGTKTPYPPGTTNFHHEMELALAIGRPVFRATRDEAMAAIYGYACALDMTRRDLQISEREKKRPWDLGKDVEKSAIIAEITPAGSFGRIADQVIRLSVNGETRQDASLEEMIWKADEIISHLSGFYHLAPGDLILTGTPAGVGPVTAGDHIEGHIDGLAPVELTLTEPE